jgi:hypothetical protein
MPDGSADVTSPSASLPRHRGALAVTALLVLVAIGVLAVVIARGAPSQSQAYRDGYASGAASYVVEQPGYGEGLGTKDPSINFVPSVCATGPLALRDRTSAAAIEQWTQGCYAGVADAKQRRTAQ